MTSEFKLLDLKNYKKVYLIGKGGFSHVFLVRDNQTLKEYAAKVSIFMVNDENRDEKETRALFREINDNS